MQSNALVSAVQHFNSGTPAYKQRAVYKLKPLDSGAMLQQTHITKDEMILALLDRKRCNLEYRAAILVRDFYYDIKNMIGVVINYAKSRTGSYAYDIITGAERFSLDSFQERFLTYELDLILIDIENKLQNKIKCDFNLVLKADLTIMPSVVLCNDDLDFIKGLVLQYQTTHAINKVAAKIANDSCNKTLAHMKLPWIIDQISRKMDFGCKALSLFDCHPQAEATRCARALEKCFNGVLDNIGLRIITEIKRRVSDGIYNLLDATIIAEIKNRENSLKLGAIRRKAKHRRKHLVLVEEAV